MKLLVIRHAIAVDRDDFAESGRDDALRPLTQMGKWKMQHAAAGLKVAVRSLDLLATSPLERAVQTGAIVRDAFPDVPTEVTESLTPESPPEALLEFLREHEERDTVAVVGHEPHLSAVTSWLLSGDDNPVIAFKKGGACLLEFRSTPNAGAATLQWALTPGLLRRLGDGG